MTHSGTKRKNILLIGEYFYEENLGGAEIQTYFVGKLLEKHYFIFYLLLLGNTKGQYDKIQIINLEGNVTSNKIKKVLIENKIDVIYSREFRYNYLIFPICKKLGIKIIYHVASISYCYRFGKFSKFKKYFYSLNHYRNYSAAISYSDFILCQNIEQKKKLTKHKILNNKIKIKIIPNIFYYNDNSIIKSNKIENQIIWVGNIKPVKQPKIFFKLAKDERLANFQFVMVGALQDISYEDKLKKLQKYNTRFKYLGYVPYKDTLKLIAKSKLLVNVSHHEGFSNTFIQAFAFGVPVLSLNSNPNDIFNNYKIGFYTKTYEKLVGKILLLQNNSVLYREMMQECIKYYNNNYSIESLNNQYINVIQQVTNET